MKKETRAPGRERIRTHVTDVILPELKGSILDSAISLHEELLSNKEIPASKLVEALNQLEATLLQETAKQLRQELT